jgi:hypothetical protein
MRGGRFRGSLTGLFSLSGLSRLFRSLNQTNQRNQTNQMNQLNQLPATCREMGAGTFFPGLSISFLDNALAGWPFPDRVNSLILRTIYGHLTRR